MKVRNGGKNDGSIDQLIDFLNTTTRAVGNSFEQIVSVQDPLYDTAIGSLLLVQRGKGCGYLPNCRRILSCRRIQVKLRRV